MLYNVIVIIIIMLLLLSEPGCSVAPVADGVSGPGHRIIDRLKGGDDIFHLIYSSLYGASNCGSCRWWKTAQHLTTLHQNLMTLA